MEAYRAFTRLNLFKDSQDKANLAYYLFAEECLSNGEYERAYFLFKDINYGDSADKAIQIAAQMTEDSLKNPSVGDIVWLGTYDYDGDKDNGTELIPWRVHDIQDGKALLLTCDVITYLQYNSNGLETTWENCTLRRWLNHDFYDTAFNDKEKSIIVETTVNAERNPRYDTDPGNDTIDNVFLLSIYEAEQYFPISGHRVVESRKTWWLRSPGASEGCAACVETDGSLFDQNAQSNSFGVRPALWIDLQP